MKSSNERVSDLERLSDRVYSALDETTKGEVRSRTILRLGVNLLADELQRGSSLTKSGTKLLALNQEQLLRGGLSIESAVYNEFPRYQAFASHFPSPSPFRYGGLDSLANRYGDVVRATLDNQGNRETDARHAVHLMSVAVPYAAQYYPELNLGLVGSYALIHDFPEAYTGDTPTFGMSHEEYASKIAREESAIDQLRQDLSRHPELFNLINAYEHQTQSEAQFIKRFDKEDPYFTHQKNRGKQLVAFYGIQSAKAFLKSTIPTTERIAAYPGSFPLLTEDRAEFISRIARNSDWPDTQN
jgi:5'-deoxynucleotidase YfbR-like HD superfamily hydrolase